MEVKIKSTSTNPLPTYQTIGSAGMDVCADLKESVTILQGKYALIPTGLFMEIPFGFEVQVRSRSGLAFKYGIFVLNSPGTIDSDYRGELKIVLMNLGEVDFTINSGDRIAQIILNKVEQINWSVIDELSDTQRGRGGYGSTGI